MNASHPNVWARAVRDRLGSEGGPLALIERPSPDASARMYAAMYDGVARCACGFLPDEVGLGARNLGDLSAWMERAYRFVPYVLPLPSTNLAKQGEVVLTQEGLDDARSRGAVLAEAWAALLRVPLRIVDVATTAPQEVADRVACACVVVNTVADWTFGFAVDFAAASAGALCIRFGSIAYSALRSALLGEAFIEVRRDESVSLRSLLDPTGLSETGIGVVERLWLMGGDEAAQLWGPLYGAGSLRDFWIGARWSDIEARSREGESGGLESVVGWAALAALWRVGDLPRPVFRNLEGRLAAAVADARRSGRGGRVLEAAVPRWIGCVPEWLDVFRAAAGDSPETRRSVLRWVETAIETAICPRPLHIVVERASWALPETGVAREGWARLLTWSRGEFDGAFAVDAPGIADAWRGVCVESVGHAGRDRAARVLGFPEDVWEATFGECALPLRAVTNLEVGRSCEVRNDLRSAARRLGLSACGGWARILRTCARDRAAFVRLLGRQASQRRGLEQIVGALIESWYRTNVWALWRRQQERAWERDLSLANEVLEIVQTRHAPAPGELHLRACLAVLSRDKTRLDACLATWAGGNVPEDLSVLLGMAGWIRGDTSRLGKVSFACEAAKREPVGLLFNRAVALQLSDRRQELDEALDLLFARAPRFLRSARPPDGRLVWAALLQRASGAPGATEGFSWLSENGEWGCPPMLSEELNPISEVSERWSRLFAQLPWMQT